MNFKLYRLYIFIILCQAAVFGQKKEVISKERFDVLIDSLLTEFQRNFLEIIFGNPMHRPKTICYIGEDINVRHDDVKDYCDGEDCEIEISQLIGEGHQPYQVGSNLFFKGTRGTLAVINDFTEQNEYQITFWGIQHAISTFVDCFMSRIWELYDQSNNIKK